MRPPAPSPWKEAPAVSSPDGRLAAVRRLEETAVGSRALRRLAELAVRLLGAPSAQIVLLGETQLVVGGAGLPPGAVGGRSPLGESLCTVAAAAGPDPLVVADAPRDGRVSGLPPVTSGRVGSYLGIPLADGDEQLVGALCVFGPEPRAWSDGDLALLRQLADSVATELEFSALAREFEAQRLRFELAIDAAEIGSFDWDLVSGRLVWDDRLVALFGYERDTFAETIEAFTARLHPDDLPRVDEALRTAIETCGGYEAEYRVVLPSGEIRWIRARGRAVADDRGIAVRLLGAAYDTTEQRDADARVARVLETMTAAFFALDRDWRFAYVNAEAERLLLHPREELIGGSIWELFPEAVGSDFETNYRGAAATGEERVFEAHYPPPLDAWYEVRAWPSPDGLSVYFLDISERRAAEERARRSAARLALLAEVGSVLSRALGDDPDEAVALQRVAEAVVPVLGDWAIVSLLDEGRVRDVGSWHRDCALRAAAARYAELRLASLAGTAPGFRALPPRQLPVVPDPPGAGRPAPPAGAGPPGPPGAG